MITKNVLTRSVNADNLMEAAKVAEDNLHMEEYSQALDEICSNFVLENPFGTLKLFSNIDSEDGKEHPFTLNKAMARVIGKKDLPNYCKHCKLDLCLTCLLSD